MSHSPIQVLKFGSSVLPNAEQLHTAVHEIYRHWRDGKKVIAVTSAIGNTTDRLLHQAGLIADQQNDEAIAELLATGETEAVALLKVALAKAGIPAYALTARCLGVQTEGPILDANPIALDCKPLLQRLQKRSVIVVPGFVGVQADGNLSLLGRGGSDLTALVIAHELKQRPQVRSINEADACNEVHCRLLKDVPGLYQWDPAADGPPPRRYRSVGFDEAADIGGAVLQPKAVRYAQKHKLRFELGQCASDRTTRVGAERTQLAESCSAVATLAPNRKLRVALWGLGTVGSGVYHYLTQHSDKFDLVELVAADPSKPRALKPPIEQLNSLANPLRIEPRPNASTQADVIVELAVSAAGFAPKLLNALEAGTAVVSADKEFVARYASALAPYRQILGGGLRCSAAVTGVVPALETAQRIADDIGVAKIQGVLNGTTNFILQQIADGQSYENALQEAQQLGYAEADPSADVYGWDAARKLSLLIQQAWNITLSPERIPCCGIAALTADQAHPNLRLVAKAIQEADGRVHASVQPVQLSDGHPLLSAQGVGNSLLITDGNGGTHQLTGAGAGKWPTAEAVFADLLDLWRERSQDRTPEPQLQEVPA